MDFSTEVPPLWIRSVYQDEFLFPSPVLQLLFPGNRIGGCLVRLQVDEPVNIIACGMMDHATPVFFQATCHVRRDADIECAPVLTGENIHDRIAFHILRIELLV